MDFKQKRDTNYIRVLQVSQRLFSERKVMKTSRHQAFKSLFRDTEPVR